MEDAVIGFVALVLQGMLATVRASIRPWQYCFSAARRNEIQRGWDAGTKIRKYMQLFGGALVALLSIAVVSSLVWGVYLALKPEPTPLERIKHHIQESVR